MSSSSKKPAAAFASFIDRAKHQEREEAKEPNGTDGNSAQELARDNVHQIREPAVETPDAKVPNDADLVPEEQPRPTSPLPEEEQAQDAPPPSKRTRAKRSSSKPSHNRRPPIPEKPAPKATGGKGTIDDPRHRQRDGKDTTRKSFFLTNELIADLAVFCAWPRRQENTFVEETLRKEIARLRAKG